MTTQTPDYNVLTVAWINHRLREIAEEENQLVEEAPDLKQRLSHCSNSVRASVVAVGGKFVESVMKPVFAAHR